MEVKIATRTQTTKLGPGFTVTPVIETEYMVGDFGPFTVQIPKAEWSKERERTEIEKEALEIKEASVPFEI